MNKNRIIAGVPARLVREFLRKIEKPFTTREAANFMTWRDTDGAAAFVGGLAACGYLEGREGQWTVSAAGTALAKEKMVHQFTRVEADKALLGVVKRAEQAVLWPDLGYYIENLYVLGEYLTNAEEISELTFAAGLAPMPDTDVNGESSYLEWLVARTLGYLAPRERRILVVAMKHPTPGVHWKLVYSMVASSH